MRKSEWRQDHEIDYDDGNCTEDAKRCYCPPHCHEALRSLPHHPPRLFELVVHSILANKPPIRGDDEVHDEGMKR